MERQDAVAGTPELFRCPDPACQAPAEVTDRFALPSTSGPVEHVRTRCLAGHGFTPRVDSLVAWPVMEARPALGSG
jgi:hypothetical protein